MLQLPSAFRDQPLLDISKSKVVKVAEVVITEVILEHSNGEVAARYFKNENGKYHGKLELFNKNGDLTECSFYKDGKSQGEFKTYWNNGQVSLSGFAKDGKRHGELKTYWSNGDLASHTLWKEGTQCFDFDLDDLDNLENFDTAEEYGIDSEYLF